MVYVKYRHTVFGAEWRSRSAIEVGDGGVTRFSAPARTTSKDAEFRRFGYALLCPFSKGELYGNCTVKGIGCRS